MTGKFLTVKELAALLNLRESWIYDRTAKNGPEVIPHTKFGRQVRFDVESNEFRSWLKAHGVVAEGTFPTSLTA
jgi:excisionase family DNA binding protein